MLRLFILLTICVTMTFPTIALTAPATCQEKVLDTVTVQGKYIGYNSSEFHVILEIDGLSESFGIMASEDEVKRAFGENYGANVEVTYDVEQVFFEEDETCYRHDVFVSGRLLENGSQSNDVATKTETMETAPLKVTMYEKSGYVGNMSITNRYIKFTSIVDSLVIENVIVNRGNVTFQKVLSTQDIIAGMKPGADMKAIMDKSIFPATLVYGKDLEVLVPRDSNILEVQVVTNYGDWVLNF